MKIAVIGDGGWGTANALLLAGYGHEVTLWGAFPDYIAEMRRTRRNEKFLKPPYAAAWIPAFWQPAPF